MLGFGLGLGIQLVGSTKGSQIAPVDPLLIQWQAYNARATTAGAVADPDIPCVFTRFVAIMSK